MKFGALLHDIKITSVTFSGSFKTSLSIYLWATLGSLTYEKTDEET